MASTSKVRAKVIELHKEETKELDKKLAIYKFGSDNLYPERIERIIHNSPTARSATDLLKEYILGKGISGFNELQVNPDQTGWELLNDICGSYAHHKGAVINVGYNAEFKVQEIRIVPFTTARKGKKDDKEWTAKIALSEDWSKAKEGDVDLVDTFNPISKVIAAQAGKAEENEKSYKGQILYFNPENATYPLAWIDPAYNDADSEYRAGLYKNTMLRKGFFGKTVFVHKPLMAELTDVEQEALSDPEKAAYQKSSTESDEVRKTVENFLGAENADGVLRLEMDPGYEGKMEDAFFFKNIESNIDDKLFEFTEKSTANNIRKSIKRIPSILIERNDSALFGNSGAMLLEGKLQFQESTSPDRKNIQTVLKRILMHGTDELKAFEDKEIEELIKKPETTPQPTD